jgi:hypothetical protein
MSPRSKPAGGSEKSTLLSRMAVPVLYYMAER